MAECDELPDRVTADFATFESALSLREALYRLALDRVLDRPFDPGSLRIVNDTAAGPVPTNKLSDAGLHMSGALLAVLAEIARRGIAVLADPHACLKECGRAGCTRICLDRSRGARRTWCGMDECGNRVKAAAYRARRRASDCAEPVQVLPADVGEGRRCLLQMQVTAGSALGALVLNTGGLLVDDGWVRVFGGGSVADGRLPGLAQVNRFPREFDPGWRPATGLVVGHDVVGGVFALNGGDPAAVGRPGVPGQMTYFAPDALAWEAMEMGCSGWVSWLLSGGLETFCDGLRWPGWREEAAALGLSQGISV